MSILFGRAREIESQFERFFDTISEAGLLFNEGIKDYLSRHRLKSVQDLTGAMLQPGEA